MADREKVIKALGICAGDNDFSVCINEKCPYIGGAKDGYCITNLERDALAMLKEQEEEIENLKQTAQSMMEGVCLLKEQEAKTVESIQMYRSDKWGTDLTGYCPSCNRPLKEQFNKCFCGFCGQAVKWE